MSVREKQYRVYVCTALQSLSGMSISFMDLITPKKYTDVSGGRSRILEKLRGENN